MKIIKWGDRKLKVYFSTRKIEKLEKELKIKDKMFYGSSNIGKGLIYIRTNVDKKFQRCTLWHELHHFLLHSLGALETEALVEMSARFVDEILARNKWVRELY